MRAFLVLGAESSGTRLMTQILIDGGCRGSAEMEQPFDHVIPPVESTPVPIVWRRSVPHGGKWPSIGSLLLLLVSRGYEPYAVVMFRDWLATVKSQVSHGHVKTHEDAWINVQRAYKHIMRGIAVAPYIMVSYEALIQYPYVVQGWIGGGLELPNPQPDVVIRDEDRKWLT